VAWPVRRLPVALAYVARGYPKSVLTPARGTFTVAPLVVRAAIVGGGETPVLPPISASVNTHRLSVPQKALSPVRVVTTVFVADGGVGRVRASRLSGRMVERAYQQLEAAGYSRTTLRTLHLVLGKAFGEQAGRPLGAGKPRESDDRRAVWTVDEVRAFHEHVAADRLFPMWRLLLTTGLRRGELCGLRWCDLEPDVATLTVRRQRVVEEPTSRVREKPPKSHNGTRSLVLDPATLTVVTGARPQGRKALVPGYMFTGRQGQPLRPDNVTDRFNQLAAAAAVARVPRTLRDSSRRTSPRPPRR
jgi:integrase